MSPTKLRDQLLSAGVKLRVDRDGTLRASKGMSPEQRELITKHKRALIAVLTYQCPECNQPLRTRATTNDDTWLECMTDAAHFGERLGRFEMIKCLGDECGEEIDLTDGQGWCPKHAMTVTVR